mmetsp:Transcript_1797/g.3902  ORF Transcript_1797/g.3902 Transcript_1797/m.3902 type:complete len:127 (+) Transcript_1797:1339-1719(+)
MNLESKATLVRKLIKSPLALTETADWQRRPEKVKNDLIIEEAARCIARKKLRMIESVDENRRLIAKLDNVAYKQSSKFTENCKLLAQKTELEQNLSKVRAEHDRKHDNLTAALSGLQKQNSEVRAT